MAESLQLLLIFIAFAAAGSSIYFSFRSRKAAPEAKGLLLANMNISMGIMLICLGSIQLFFFFDTWLRIAVGTVFMLLGLINLIAGWKNRKHFKSLEKPTSE